MKETAFKGSKHTLYINEKVGCLTILSKGENKILNNGDAASTVIVKCNCGNIKTLEARKLIQYKTKGNRYCTKCMRKDLNVDCLELSKTYILRLKATAIKRDLEFNITSKDIYNLYIKQNKKCALSGLDIYFRSGDTGRDNTASVDRINNNLGYTIDNIQILHKDVNRLKTNFEQDYLIKLCELVYKTRLASDLYIKEGNTGNSSITPSPIFY